MSSIKLESNASGTGVFTIASPNSNTNRTLTLPDATGTIITTAGGAAISGTTGTFTGLVDISAAGAGQIQFPATQNASSDANTLDDYEEGTWTPGMIINNSTTGIVFDVQVGRYTKIGRQVTAYCGVVLSNKGSSSGAMYITGLPFTALDPGAYGDPVMSVGFVDGLNTSAAPLVGLVTRGNTRLEVRKIASGATSVLTNTDLTNSSAFIVTTTYFV